MDFTAMTKEDRLRYFRRELKLSLYDQLAFPYSFRARLRTFSKKPGVIQACKTNFYGYCMVIGVYKRFGEI